VHFAETPTGIAAGDIAGDGVDDLAYVGPMGLVVLHGLPVTP
jgi:hypothetical protein